MRARAAVARAARRAAARSLPRVAVRGDAPADHGRRRSSPISRTSPRAGRRVEALAAADDADADGRLGGARLLRPRAQPARLRARGGGARAAFPTPKPSCSSCPGIGALHRGGDRGDRLRPARGGGRRQCRARRRAAVRDRPSRCPAREAGDPPRRRFDHARRARRRLRAGDDGPRRDDLHDRARPRCLLCPLARVCAGSAAGAPEPIRSRPRKTRQAAAAAAPPSGSSATAQVLLVRRPAKGMLGGMRALPTGPGAMRRPGLADAPIAADWRCSARSCRHVFTHFDARPRARGCDDSESDCRRAEQGEWWPIDRARRGGPADVVRQGGAGDFGRRAY